MSHQIAHRGLAAIVASILFTQIVCAESPPKAAATRPAVTRPAGTRPAGELLRERFFTDYPELRSRWDGLSDWNKVRYLRTWTWSWVDVAFDPHLHASLGKNTIETIDLFDKDCGGVWCEGASSSLIQVYQDFGFEAYNLSISMVPPATEWGAHVMTLVRINDSQGKPIWSLQDAYFNSCLADAHGEPIDYLAFLQRLKSGELDQVQVLEMEMPVKEWPAVIVPPERSQGREVEELRFEHWPVDLEQYRIEGASGDWVKIKSPRTAKLYASRFYYFKEILEANDLPANSILAFVYSDHSFEGDPKYLAQIQSLQNTPPLKPLPYKKYKVWFSSAGYREIPWRWSNRRSDNEPGILEIAKAGKHTLHLWMGEPRVPIDRLLLSQDPNIGPADFATADPEEVIVVEAEDAARNVARSDALWLLCDRQGKRHSGRGFMVSQPRERKFDIARCRDEAPELQFELDFPRAGRWHVFVRTNTVIPPNDLIHVGLDGTPVYSMELSER